MYKFKSNTVKHIPKQIPQKGTSLLSKLVKDTDYNSDSEKTIESMYDYLDIIVKKSPVIT